MKYTGVQLFVNFGCTKCHGENLSGTVNGPQLANLNEYWNRNTLIAYLRNPGSFMEEERFKEYRQLFPKSDNARLWEQKHKGSWQVG